MSGEIKALSSPFGPEQAIGWLEIDLSALARNALAVKKLLKPNCRLLGVVKANGYGLGALPVARALEDIADMLGVTTAEEGIQLRRGGIKLPILVFLPPDAGQAAAFAQYNLTATIDSPQRAALLEKALSSPVDCHLKINTGMNRLGTNAGDALLCAQALDKAKNLHLTGVYSHFYQAAPRFGAAAQRQLAVFKTALSALEESGLKPPLVHMANSAAILQEPQSHFNMVRCGTLLYGQSPAAKNPPGFQLEDPFRACCRITAVRDIPKGGRIGYGGEFTASRPCKIAILPLGYADGFGISPPPRPGFVNILRESLMEIARLIVKRPRHYAYIEGLRLPLAGRIAMQMSAVDISRAPFLQPGDAVGLSLRRICASPLLPRVYITDEQRAEYASLEAESPALPRHQGEGLLEQGESL